MNIGTHFDYNHIAFISTHTKIGMPHEKAPVTVQTEVNLLIWLFECSGYFSPMSSSNYKQAIDKNRNLGKAS